MFVAVAVSGRVQMYTRCPSFTYVRVVACGVPFEDDVASVNVACAPR
jgi:hypothetical protein